MIIIMITVCLRQMAFVRQALTDVHVNCVSQFCYPLTLISR